MSLKYAYYRYITLMRLAGRVLRRRASDVGDLSGRVLPRNAAMSDNENTPIEPIEMWDAEEDFVSDQVSTGDTCEEAPAPASASASASASESQRRSPFTPTDAMYANALNKYEHETANSADESTCSKIGGKSDGWPCPQCGETLTSFVQNRKRVRAVYGIDGGVTTAAAPAAAVFKCLSAETSRDYGKDPKKACIGCPVCSQQLAIDVNALKADLDKVLREMVHR